MSGLSPLTMFQGNSKELMIEQNRSRKSHKLAKPKFLGKISASLARFAAFVKGKSQSRSAKRGGKRPAIVVEATSATAAPIQDEVQHDVFESPITPTLPSAAVSPNSSSTSNTTTLDSMPTDLLRNIFDNLTPMDVICFGLARKRAWAAAKNHLVSEGLYPARFVLTDVWGSYQARPTVYYNLPERLETWMAPRVLFHRSIPRIFVKNEARARHMMIYYRMVRDALASHYRAPECIDLLEYYRPNWVLPICRGLFEKWEHLGVHDYKNCTICHSVIRALSRPVNSRTSNPQPINPLLQTIVSSVSSLEMSTLKNLSHRREGE